MGREKKCQSVRVQWLLFFFRDQQRDDQVSYREMVLCNQTLHNEIRCQVLLWRQGLDIYMETRKVYRYHGHWHKTPPTRDSERGLCQPD